MTMSSVSMLSVILNRDLKIGLSFAVHALNIFVTQPIPCVVRHHSKAV